MRIPKAEYGPRRQTTGQHDCAQYGHAPRIWGSHPLACCNRCSNSIQYRHSVLIVPPTALVITNCGSTQVVGGDGESRWILSRGDVGLFCSKTPAKLWNHHASNRHLFRKPLTRLHMQQWRWQLAWQCMTPKRSTLPVSGRPACFPPGFPNMGEISPFASAFAAAQGGPFSQSQSPSRTRVVGFEERSASAGLDPLRSQTCSIAERQGSLGGLNQLFRAASLQHEAEQPRTRLSIKTARSLRTASTPRMRRVARIEEHEPAASGSGGANDVLGTAAPSQQPLLQRSLARTASGNIDMPAR